MNYTPYWRPCSKDQRYYYRTNAAKNSPSGYFYCYESEDGASDAYCSDSCESIEYTEYTDDSDEKLCEDCKRFLSENLCSLKSERSRSRYKYGTYENHRQRDKKSDAMYSRVVPRGKQRNIDFESSGNLNYPCNNKRHKVRSNYCVDEYELKHKRKKPLRIIDSKDSLRHIMDSSGELTSALSFEHSKEKKYESCEQYMEILHAIEKYNAKKRQDCKKPEARQCAEGNCALKKNDRVCSSNKRSCSRPESRGKKSKLCKSCSVQTSIVLTSPRTNKGDTTRSKSCQTSRHRPNAFWNMALQPSQRALGTSSHKSCPAARQINRKQNNQPENTTQVTKHVNDPIKAYETSGKAMEFEQVKVDTYDKGGPETTKRPISRDCTLRRHPCSKKRASYSEVKLSVFERKFQQKFERLTRRMDGKKKNRNQDNQQGLMNGKQTSLVVNAADIAQLANMIQKLTNQQAKR